jgi:hypothetical protein
MEDHRSIVRRSIDRQRLITAHHHFFVALVCTAAVALLVGYSIGYYAAALDAKELISTSRGEKRK